MGLDTSERRSGLDAFALALSREAHNLARWPDLTWQQLHNRLPSSDEPVARAWIRARTRFGESESLVRILKGHADSVVECAVSPDGSFAVSRAEDGSLKIWDYRTGAERAAVRDTGAEDEQAQLASLFSVTAGGQAAESPACAVSPDGSFVLTRSPSGDATIRDPATGLARAMLPGGATRAWSIAAGGATVVTGDSDGYVHVWDTGSAEQRSSFKSGAASIHLCASSPAGRYLVCAGASGTGSPVLETWSEGGERLARLTGHTDRISACAVSPDDSFVATASHDGTLRVWDPDTGEQRARAQLGSPTYRKIDPHRDMGRFVERGSTGNIHRFLITPDAALIVSWASRPRKITTRYDLVTKPDGALTVWDPRTGERLATLAGHTGWVNACAVSPDGSFVVSASRDGTLGVWDPAAGRRLAVLVGHTDGVNTCAIGPDGLVLSAGDDNTIRVWDPLPGAGRPALPRHSGAVTACAMSADGSVVASASTDGTLKLWDRDSGDERATLEGHTEAVESCVASPDGSFVVSASRDGTLRVWDPSGGRPLRTLGRRRSRVTAGSPMALSADASFLVAGGRAREHGGAPVELWDPRTGERLATLRARSGRERLRGPWRTGRGESTRRHLGSIFAFAVSPDGSLIVSAGHDGMLRRWDRRGRMTGAIRTELLSWEFFDLPMAISPDGLSVVTGGGRAEGDLKLWDLTTLTRSATVPGHTGLVLACAFSPDGTAAVSQSEDGDLCVWDVPGWRLRWTKDRRYQHFAVTPDGRHVVTYSPDGLDVLDLAGGGELARLPTLGQVTALSMHAWLPLVACGDRGGNFYLLEPVGLEPGPVIVTAVDDGGGAVVVRCPRCRGAHPLQREWPGRAIACPACALELRVTPFVAGAGREVAS